jgi:hypothetical protein
MRESCGCNGDRGISEPTLGSLISKYFIRSDSRKA